MSVPTLNLANPPIVEAILDIDCDLPPATDIAALETPARERLLDQYPIFRTQLIQEHQIKHDGSTAPEMSFNQRVQALRFFREDEKQLVQVRSQGFSFNRLSPYSSLDNYLPEIERTWRLFVEVAAPVQVRLVRLRYINRMLLPTTGGRVELDDYLKFGPHLPEEVKLTLAGFIHQHSAVDESTGNQANIVLTLQGRENGYLPVILDIETFGSGVGEPNDWPSILSKVQSLRSLKNVIFASSLTDRCVKLFQK